MKTTQHASVGMFHLEEAMLGLLDAANDEGKCLGPTEISRRLGIFHEGYPSASGLGVSSCAIVWGVLAKLYHEDSRIQKCTRPKAQCGNPHHAKGGWQLSSREVALRSRAEQ